MVTVIVEIAGIKEEAKVPNEKVGGLIATIVEENTK